ncbi:uncharacterized protein BDR25DRAFT_313305 [Lindgomyces ingoldianus]|uniref:Uncharacterized protein n=1 Tax=Lindgomyces ingoldianus TaxID=673940 RepID=A0ACB6R0T2_9PLEO|nr:uncharacterized protein BDR25DRAFT_313305 [Lindgomyces ingoldianus]KAF2472122.1 hypothetical protein BDR25DRAFT_313305 [Lindgomyces ingoldianus]
MSAPSSTQPFIAIEESYLSPDIPTTLSPNPRDPALHLIPAPTLSKLKNIGPARIRDMRASGTAMQILSHIPLDLPLKTCQRINDMLYSNIVTNSDRFAAMALLPVGDAKDAASELQRCVTKYKFVGCVLGIRKGGVQLDGTEWDGVWTMAEKYKVPVALRPVWPCGEEKRIRRERYGLMGLQVSEYTGLYPQSLICPLVTVLYPHHTTSPLLLLRLYASGLFERHPHLRLILSQNGHSIPSLLPRIQSLLASTPDFKPVRKFFEVWQYNIYISTADIMDVSSLRALVERIPVDRVLWAGNYPWEEKGAKNILWECREMGVLGKEEWEEIAWKNAERLFGVKTGVADKGGAAGMRGRRASFG